jgi:L-ascorbate metabolism protein UlaG (beta-lactamase superfamily)
MSLALTWLGHSTVVIDVDGTRVLTDPLLSRHAGPLRRRHPRPAVEAFADPDAVLISHLHHDHCELTSLRMLPEVPVLTSDGNARWLRRRRIAGGTGMGEGWVPIGDGGVEARLTRADHRHRPMPHRPNDAHGHLVRAPSATLWAVGDTSLFDDMRTLAEPLGRPLDVALVPISGWGSRLSEGHLDGPQAAEACARTGARWALPVHWGTFHVPFLGDRPSGWMDRPRHEFEEALARLAPQCRVVDLLPGETWTMPSA